MRYSITINNIKALEWGLTIQQAYLFSWFYELPSWANKVMIENEIFYFASKNKAVEELPILTDKTDTMYRYYRQLEELELIVIKKIDGKDYISLTTKAKEWNLYKSDYSENYPNELGKLSENNSDLNPTYNIYNINNINNNKESTLFQNDLEDESLETKKEKEKQAKEKDKINFDNLILYYNKVLNKKCKIIPKDVKIKFNNLLKDGYEKSDIKKVIDNVSFDTNHKENNFKYVTFEFLSRPKIFERYASMEHKKPQNKDGHINW